MFSDEDRKKFGELGAENKEKVKASNVRASTPSFFVLKKLRFVRLKELMKLLGIDPAERLEKCQ